MTTLRVGLGTRGYDVEIEGGLIDRAVERLLPLLSRRAIFIVTDANVAGALLPRLVASLEKASIACDVRVVQAGEASKSWSELGATVEWLIASGCERGDVVVALGGGVVGDLAGFAAAIVKRGCRHVQVPTSLLAQVDASVGGKTAVNMAAGKNLAGAFHQPALVLIDPQVLTTLPRRHMRAGYAEIVKYGLIADAGFYRWCEENGGDVIAGDEATLLHAIEYCVAAKAGIVAADERDEGGVRALLNLGHSFAHAFETEAGLDGDVLHGEAVATGIALAFGYSARLGLCAERDARRVTEHFASTGLRTTARDLGCRASGSELVGLMMQDKKNVGRAITLVLARGIGAALVRPGIDAGDLARFLDEQHV